MAIPLEKQSLNQHIERLCEEFPEFKKFDSKFKGEYNIVAIDEYMESARKYTATIRIEFTGKGMNNMVATLEVNKRISK